MPSEPDTADCPQCGHPWHPRQAPCSNSRCPATGGPDGKDAERPETARQPLSKVAPIGLAPEHSFVHEANRIMRWYINAAGGAYVDEAAVDRIDRMVNALIQIKNGWCADPKAVAKEALS